MDASEKVVREGHKTWDVLLDNNFVSHIDDEEKKKLSRYNRQPSTSDWFSTACV